MRRTVFGSATKFCPSARLGASPCSASSSRIRVGVCVTAPASQTPNSYTPPQQNRHKSHTPTHPPTHLTPPPPPPQQNTQTPTTTTPTPQPKTEDNEQTRDALATATRPKTATTRPNVLTPTAREA